MKKALSSVLCLAMLLTMLLPATAFAADTDFVPNPKTTYATDFINKCEGQQWFINEVERLLNAEQKTLDTIENRSELDVIKAIGFRNNEITGKIPAAIGELKELRYLFLSGNHFSGAIPAGLYALPKLENVDLSDNDYTGSIPTGFGSMASLKVLMLANNSFTGTIPNSILNNTRIEVLDLHSNQLSGGVPAGLSGMTALTYLDLAGNTWGGTIPDLSALTNLIALDFGGCNLAGTIPDSIYSLSKLQILNLGSNKLTGEISDSLASLTQMQCLILDNNQLRGTIPSNFTLDTSGSADPIAHLENNFLRGTVPAKLAAAVSAGAKVYLDNNYMGGTAVTETASYAGDFADNVSGQYQLSTKQTHVNIFQTGTVNLYPLLENKALFSTNAEKPLLKPVEYSADFDSAKVDVVISDSGITVKALTEIPKAEAIPVKISILGNESVARSTVSIYVTTDDVNTNPGGGGGGGGGTSSTTYSISTDDNMVSLDKSRAKAKESITITVSPNGDGTYTEPVVKDKSGNTITVTDLGNGVFTFVMPNSNVTVNPGSFADCLRDASCPIYPFKDTNPAEWYHNGVHFCLEMGYMNGIKKTVFAPNNTTSRAMIVTILYRLEGEPAVSGDAGYTDLTQDWYRDAVLWGTQAGVVNGYGKGRFGPSNPITREQLATILYRYAEYKQYDTSDSRDISGYQDADQVSGWALNGVKWANAALPMAGRSNSTLAPKGTATRAEAATLIYRFCRNVAE